MKYTALILLLFILGSCTNIAENTEENTTIKLPPLAEKVLGNKGKFFRGFDFESPLEEIKGVETLDVLEEHPQGIIYSFDTQDLETVDIYYKTDSTLKLKSIKTDIYLNEEADNQMLFDSFKSYYSSKYKVVEQNDTLVIWENQSATLEVGLYKVNKNRDIGLALLFSKQ